MKKGILPLMLALLVLSGCGAAAKDAYTAGDAAALLEAGVFTGEMEAVDGEIAAGIYGIDWADVVDSSCYMAINTAVSADEVAVFVLTDQEAAQAAEEAFLAHIETRMDSCRTYCPDQVPKLEQGVVSRLGSTVLLAVGEPAPLAQAIQALS